MKSLFTLVASMSLSASALAGDVTVEWSLATTREDGAALSVAEIASHRIQWGTCAGYQMFDQPLGELVVAMPSTSVLLVGLTAGERCIRGFTIDKEGLESEPSNVATVRIKHRPNPPTIVVLGAN